MQELTEKQEEALKEAGEVMSELTGKMEKISYGVAELLEQDVEIDIDEILDDIESAQTELFSLGARLDDAFA